MELNDLASLGGLVLGHIYPAPAFRKALANGRAKASVQPSAHVLQQTYCCLWSAFGIVSFASLVV
jgi:hypothetical protein